MTADIREQVRELLPKSASKVPARAAGHPSAGWWAMSGADGGGADAPDRTLGLALNGAGS